MYRSGNAHCKNRRMPSLPQPDATAAGAERPPDPTMRPIPREPGFDSSLALLADPYRYIVNRCRAHSADLFETRLLLRRTICMTGPRAAELFYDSARFRRHGAAPEPVRATLFGKGGVQGLDGEPHRERKAMFMRLATPPRVELLARLVAGELARSVGSWAAAGPIPLYRSLHAPLTRAVCEWAGVPLPAADLHLRTRQLTALFDRVARSPADHLQTRLERRRAERWIAHMVHEVRVGHLALPEDSALRMIATHRDGGGNLLPPRVAAVEVLNLLRPTVAVSVFIVFAAHALHKHPECRAILGAGDPGYAECFVQEVRRWYPFFPAVAAVVREDFEWDRYFFPRGRRVLLDIHGTNRDPRSWEAPELFRPARFREPPAPWSFIPQGGGEPGSNHRCPGEGIAVALMKTAVDFLLHRLRYSVPRQDLHIDYGRLPALPRDGFVIANVRPIEPERGARPVRRAL